MIQLLLLPVLMMLSTTPGTGQTAQPSQTFFDGIGRPSYERQDTSNGTTHMWELQSEKGSFQVVYQRNKLRRAVRYDGTIARAIQSSGGTLEDASNFVMDDDNTGRDVTIKLPDDKVLRMRVVADSLREIRLTHIGPRSNPFAADVERFFKSARFLD